MSIYNGLTGQYPLTKTISIGLVPVGKTLEHINEDGVLDSDIQLTKDFNAVKKIADDFHRSFIDSTLDTLQLKVTSDGKQDSLQEYMDCYLNAAKDEGFLDVFDNVCANLRKQVAAVFRQQDIFPKLDKKDLFNILKEGANENEVCILDKFNGFTSYFSGYNKIRMYLYTEEEKPNTIAYRLVHENLPIFIDNYRKFAEVLDVMGQDAFDELYTAMEQYLNVSSLEEAFALPAFNIYLTQKQIDVYNTLIGGMTTEKENVKGLNVYINLYNQQLDKGAKKLPLLTQLKKQMLSDRVSLSWTSAQFDSAKDMMDAIKDFHKQYLDTIPENLKHLLQNIDEYNLDGIFISNNDALSKISVRLYGKWNAIKDTLEAHYQKAVPPRKKKESEEDFMKRVSRYVAKIKSFSIASLNKIMDGEDAQIQDYFKFMGTVNNPNYQRANYFSAIESCYWSLTPLMKMEEKSLQEVVKQPSVVDDIKNYMDAVLELAQFCKAVWGRGNEPDRDGLFYNGLQEYISLFGSFKNLYDNTRNYLTRKPFSTEKVKLNFDNAFLLNGWSKEKESINRCILLRQKDTYFLAILHKDGKNLFVNAPEDKTGQGYEKMEYHLMGGASKMIPKVVFAEKNKDLYKPTAEILEIKRKGSYKAGPTYNQEDMHKMIQFYKDAVMKHPRWKEIPWNWKETTEYRNLKEFTDSFTGLDYSIEFKGIDGDWLDEQVEKGLIYLFRLQNRDMLPGSKGKPQLYTMYFRALFEPENLKNVVFKLSGGASMFYRKASLKVNKPTHPAGVPVALKNPIAAKDKKTRTFSYDLIKDRRYTMDKFMLNFPISINYTAEESRFMKVTGKVRELIRENKIKHVIGVHRGENNLLYISVLNKEGKIIEQYSMNTIGNSTTKGVFETDYHDLLQRKEEERQEARKSWKTIEQIKQIKQGYLSQVIHRIANLIIKYDAVVVMESLDEQFKRGRQKIERNIYQEFEKNLIDKLNYLVKKDAPINEPGGVLKGWQLTDTCSSYSDIRFQNGVLFYVPPTYTSNVDPVTGFVNFFSISYESIEATKAFFNKFDVIRYDVDRNLFTFKFRWSNFTGRAEGTKDEWTVCSYGNRINNEKVEGRWISEEISLTDEYKHLFDSFSIPYTANLKEAIMNVERRDFHERLVNLFRLTVQLRNVSAKKELDYLISPVADKNGVFFRSSEKNNHLPIDTDANSAYNIARKGWMVLDNICQAEDGEKPRMAVSFKEWLCKIQQV